MDKSRGDKETKMLIIGLWNAYESATEERYTKTRKSGASK